MLLKSTFLSEISEMLLKLFYLYNNSPKKMRQGIADAMEMDISAPTKATGT